MVGISYYAKTHILNQVKLKNLYYDWTHLDLNLDSSSWKNNKRRARLVADGTGLENRKGFTLLVGSNPTPSALDLNEFRAYK